MSNLGLKVDEVEISPSEKPTCTKCSKNNMGKCLVGTGNCFVFVKDGHKVKIVPSIVLEERGVAKLKQAVLIPMIQRGTTSLLSALGVNERNLPMCSPVCYKSFQ